MGEEIVIEKIAIIQGGVLQIDLLYTETKKRDRCFAAPTDFFRMLGNAIAMQENVNRT